MANPNVFTDVLKRLRCWRLVRTSIQLFVPEREVLARAVKKVELFCWNQGGDSFCCWHFLVPSRTHLTCHHAGVVYTQHKPRILNTKEEQWINLLTDYHEVCGRTFGEQDNQYLMRTKNVEGINIFIWYYRHWTAVNRKISYVKFFTFW